VKRAQCYALSVNALDLIPMEHGAWVREVDYSSAYRNYFIMAELNECLKREVEALRLSLREARRDAGTFYRGLERFGDHIGGCVAEPCTCGFNQLIELNPKYEE